MINLPSLESDIELLEGIREVLPEIRIVLIGPVAKLVAEGLPSTMSSTPSPVRSATATFCAPTGAGLFASDTA